MYGFSVRNIDKSVKIGVSVAEDGGGIYGRLQKMRICYPNNMILHYVVVTQAHGGKTSGKVAEDLEKQLHNKLTKLKGSYSTEWRTITDMTKLQKPLYELLDQNKNKWKCLVWFGEHGGSGYWKIIKNTDKFKESSISKPSLSRKSTVTSLLNI